MHVDDAAAAAVAALDASGAIGPYNITGGTVHTVQDVIDTVRRIDPRSCATPVPAGPDGALQWPARLDLTAATRDLRWRPTKDFDIAVHAYRTWLTHHRD